MSLRGRLNAGRNFENRHLLDFQTLWALLGPIWGPILGFGEPVNSTGLPVGGKAMIQMAHSHMFFLYVSMFPNLNCSCQGHGQKRLKAYLCQVSDQESFAGFGPTSLLHQMSHTSCVFEWSVVKRETTIQDQQTWPTHERLRHAT